MNFKGPAVPDRIEIATGTDSVVIRRSWRSWKIIVPGAIFAVVWDSFLFFWYFSALSKGGTPWLMIVFPLGHVAVGIGVTYFVISSIVNRTDIEISGQRVTVRTHPLPWFSDRDLASTEIVDTRIKYSYSSNRSGTYELRYRTPSNREKKLVGGLTDDESEFIEYHIRTTLGLKDASETA